MSGARIVLVHGYCGASADLSSLADALAAEHGEQSVHPVELHPGGAAGFDEGRLTDRITEAIGARRGNEKDVVLIGHSTGGLLALRAAVEPEVAPRVLLVVLLATPLELDARFAARWESHRTVGGGRPTFADLGRIARLARRVSAASPSIAAPVLEVYGGADALVLPPGVEARQGAAPGGPRRVVVIPGADHMGIAGKEYAVAVDVVLRAVKDAVFELDEGRSECAGTLVELEPSVEPALRARPGSLRHIARSPLVVRARDGRGGVALDSAAAGEPISLNVEVTTRCPNACVRCARAVLSEVVPRDMSREDFRAVLGLLPAAWRVTLVGLGEPTAHPEICALVADAIADFRQLTLVTSAALLDRRLSRELLAAGLARVVFSLDTVDRDTAAALRPGADIREVLSNARGFVEEARAAAREVEIAVFCAVGRRNAAGLPRLAAEVAALGARALVLSDLNFEHNRDDSMRVAGEDERRAVREGIRVAYASGLPVFGVKAFEEMGMARRLKELLLRAPDALWTRSARHSSCLSPWHAIPVGANGVVTMCDCRPTAEIGNILESPLDRVWNGEEMRALRTRMRSGSPPPECLACPRF